MFDLKPLYTRWGSSLDRECPHNDYPRPQLRRDNWRCLNGVWEYAIRGDDVYPEGYDGEIVVPFSPEALLSGVGRILQPNETLFYRRTVDFGAVQNGMRLLLHFGAVDQTCEVRLNGVLVGSHSGGYLPFSFDITDTVRNGENELCVAVRDQSDSGIHAYGKQKKERGGIWYTPQSGIWQTVWCELVPKNHITSVYVTTKVGEGLAFFDIAFSGESGGYKLTVSADGVTVYEGNGAVVSIPEAQFWTPDNPHLYDVRIETDGGDVVETYFGMREYGIANGRLTLNGKPVFHTGLLDQGYWSDGMYTAPSDEAMIWELNELKSMGFNMLRKHIKVEPLRWYYHCDRIGLMVWQDFPSGGAPYGKAATMYLPFLGMKLNDKPGARGLGRANADGCRIFESDAEAIVAHLKGATCVAVWVPFNEGWGQFDALRIAGNVKRLDPTRPIDHASGWHDTGGGDFASRHIYFKSYSFKKDRRGRVEALTEFGGYSCPVEGHMASEKTFGYKMFASQSELTEAFVKLYQDEIIPAVAKGLSAAIYTQVSDVEDEINGVFTYDRAVTKLDPNAVGKVNELLLNTALE